MARGIMPPIVTSKKELEYIVHEVTNYGAFAYDIESRGSS
jgi:hypothetical protein